MIRRFLIIAAILFTNTNAFSQDFEGLWRSQGYGYIAVIDSNAVQLYQVTAVSLLPFRMATIVGDQVIQEEILLGTLSRSGDNVIFTSGDNNVIKFDSIDTLPEITEGTTDPEINFEVFWHSFEENCKLFTLTGVDWQAMYNQYRPQVTAATTEQELFDIFAAMVTPLNDGHIQIYAALDGQDAFFSPGPIPTSQWIIPRRTDFFNVHIAGYLDNSTLNSAANDRFKYGTINESIGYLNVLSFFGYSGSEDIFNLDEELEISGFTENLDIVLTEFQNLDALIIDIRWNGGGLDYLGFVLASRFTDQRRLGNSKQARFGGYDEYTELHHRYFEPAGMQFLNKPVILLTSGNSASGADVQAMILKNLPNITLIGETTYGIISDMLLRNLPNGWFFGLSNERYLSREGIDYEQVGIPPDIEVFANEDSLNAGIDNILSRALRELETLTTIAPSEDELPRTFSLAQNYPNPFNPTTTIEYRLSEKSNVVLKIYNILGQEIRTLVKRVQEPGLMTVSWDGRNDAGEMVTSGMYFYKLKMGESFIATRRMLLLK